jgi:uncharacterized protein with von Willebrand factor type A (vWA) domain
MQQMTFRVADETATEIEEVASERDVSKSEVAREYLELGSEYADLQTENDRLRNRIQTLIRQREEHTELVEYVERKREVETLREERQSAPLWVRTKYWLFGYEN